MEKILPFIINKNRELLLLHGNNADPQFHESFWYVVTGAREIEDKDLLDTVKREVKEETDLDVLEIIDLNRVFKYNSLGNHCIEHAFISFVNNDMVKLNEENFEYKWCNAQEFFDRIRWFYDKGELINIFKN